jgi:hypothetical protein
MVAEYPELGFCNDFWKPQYLATTIYSSWHKHACKRSEMKKEDDSSAGSCGKRSASRVDASDDSAPPSSKKMKLRKGKQAKVSNLLTRRGLFLPVMFHIKQVEQVEQAASSP